MKPSELESPWAQIYSWYKVNGFELSAANIDKIMKANDAEVILKSLRAHDRRNGSESPRLSGSGDRALPHARLGG